MSSFYLLSAFLCPVVTAGDLKNKIKLNINFYYAVLFIEMKIEFEILFGKFNWDWIDVVTFVVISSPTLSQSSLILSLFSSSVA